MLPTARDKEVTSVVNHELVFLFWEFSMKMT
jgi:hypothetical protein